MSESKTIALVTGASSGLGEAFCRQLASRCDLIIAVARRLDRLQVLAQELAGTVEVHPVCADLATLEGVAQTLEILRQKGPVNILVNNAGYCDYGHFGSAAIEAQRGMLALHCDAAMTLARAAIPFMREAGGGSIINVSSLAAVMPGPELAVYGASKAFLTYFSQALAAELAADNIAVQALMPGLVRTEIHEPMVQQGFDPAAVPEALWMLPTDVVQASLAALVTGQVLVVPGEVNVEMARAGAQGTLDSIGV